MTPQWSQAREGVVRVDDGGARLALDRVVMGWMGARQRTSIDRVWPAFLAAATVVVIEATTLGVDLWFVRGHWAIGAAYAYALAALALVVFPHSLRLHMVVMPGSLMFWFGRAAGAFARWVETGDNVLLTVLAPAAALGVLAGTLHIYAIRFIAARDALRSHADSAPGVDG